MDTSTVLTVLAVGGGLTVALFLAVFLIFRAFWLWYWRIDEQIRLLHEIAKNTQLVEERGRPLPGGGAPPARLPRAAA